MLTLLIEHPTYSFVGIILCGIVLGVNDIVRFPVCIDSLKLALVVDPTLNS